MSEIRLVKAKVAWVAHGPLMYRALLWINPSWVEKLRIDGHAYRRRLRNRRRRR